MSVAFRLVTTPRYDRELLRAREQGFDHAGWNYERQSPLYIWEYHHRRLVKGARYFGWAQAVQSLETTQTVEALAQRIEDFVGPDQSTPLRLRVVLSPDGTIELEKYDTPAVPLGNLLPRRLVAPSASNNSSTEPEKITTSTIVVDQERTAHSDFTRFKTTQRDVYTLARLRAQLEPKDLKEVLLVNNETELVMEGSITTPYFWRDGRWVTPPVEHELGDENNGKGGQDGVSRRWALDRYVGMNNIVSIDSD